MSSHGSYFAVSLSPRRKFLIKILITSTVVVHDLSNLAPVIQWRESFEIEGAVTGHKAKY